jgi:dsDNA-specific endonuclease/ATPase MutS2
MASLSNRPISYHAISYHLQREDRVMTSYQEIRDRGEKLLEEAKKEQKVIVTAVQNSKEFKPGDKVEYISGSGKSYTATVIEIPENPWHFSTPLPTLSLTFRDETGRLIRKKRVLPISASAYNRKVYRERAKL